LSTHLLFWHFIWESDSPWSWVANILLAFILIKFLVYPALGFAFQTSHPIVAVVSGSMEHYTVHPCLGRDSLTGSCTSNNNDIYEICGKEFEIKQKSNFDTFWDICGEWYEREVNIQKEQFKSFPMKNGFNTGDIIILRGSDPEDIELGDIIVFPTRARLDPIIHRVVKIDLNQNDNTYKFQTKGDHNADSHNAIDTDIPGEYVIGKAWIRVPYLGYVKIAFIKVLDITGVLKLVQWIRGG